MNRSWLLLLLFALVVPERTARGEPFGTGPSLSPALVASVTATAFDFMAPRTLEPIPISQMAMWGLRGLTTLDARLTPDLQGGRTLRLIGPSRVLLSRPAPPPENAAAWGEAVAQMTRAAWDSSEAVRRAGTGGILRSFFDELFNHLDPYSRYATPAEAAADRARRVGRAGIGLRPTLRGGQVLVESVQPGSPASLSGVRAGDRIVAIDGEPVQGADLQSINALLAGPEGSRLTLGLRGREGPRTVVLERLALPEETVTARRQEELLVLRITSFAANTAARLGQELIAANAGAAPPPAGVVIDLRGNRGGLLRQAVAAAAMLVPGGVVASTAGRDPAAAVEYRADGGRDLAPGLPVIVIVDGRSASAAEVLAAALSDQRRAVVVGSTTLGKGLVQTIAPLPDGGELSITWARLLAPRGWPLQALGVVPQLCTSLGQDALGRNLATLSRGVQPFQTGLERHRAARPPLTPAAVLEIRAICPAAEGGDLDMVAARELVRAPAAYTAALMPPMPPRSSLGIRPIVGPGQAPVGVIMPSGLTPASAVRN